MRDDDLAPLRAALVDRWSDLAVALLGPANPKIKSKGELRWGNHGSFSVKAIGVFRDHETNEAGDLLALIRRTRGGSFIDAVKFAREFCSMPVKADRRPDTKLDDATRTKLALDIFNNAGSVNHPTARKYLDRRGLILPDGVDGPVLRFVSRCPFGPGEHHPAIIALFRGILDDEPRAIQRIALTDSGEKVGRKMLGPVDGVAIKLSRDEDVELGLHIAEGIESAISAMMLGFAPMWALGSAGAIANFPLFEGHPEFGFECCLTIIVDNDPPNAKTGKRPGPYAARVCSDRWTSAGQEVRRVMPATTGEDMNDIVRRQGQHHG